MHCKSIHKQPAFFTQHHPKPQVLRFNPSWQVSTTELLLHSPQPPSWGELERKTQRSRQEQLNNQNKVNYTTNNNSNISKCNGKWTEGGIKLKQNSCCTLQLLTTHGLTPSLTPSSDWLPSGNSPSFYSGHDIMWNMPLISYGG